MLNPIPAELGDFSEIRRLNRAGSDPAIIRRGVLGKLESNGTVSVVALTGSSYPSGSNLLSSVTTLLGVVTKDYSTTPDPVTEQTQEYGGQAESTTAKVHIALMGAHREIILPTVNNSGELDPSIAVPSNIGKAVTVRAQNYSITAGNNKYWCYPAVVLGGNDGIIVGLAGRGRVIVRLKRSFFVEMQ